MGRVARYLCILALAGLLLLLENGTCLATTILLFPQKPKPGDAAVVLVKGVPQHLSVELVARFPGTGSEKRFFWNGGEQAFLLGIPLNSKGVLLRVKTSRETQLAGVRMKLPKRQVPVSRLRLARRYLSPPKELQKKIAAQRRMLRAILSRHSDFWYPKGPPVMPLSRYRKTTPFGARRIINGVAVSPHSGVDMAAPKGTPVRAVFSGKVVFAGRLYYTGNTVVLDHGRGFFTLYAHLNSIRVKKGDFVPKGSVLGGVGSTGRATGPHLHWGAYIGGTKVDPLSLFSIPVSLWSLAGK